LIDCVKGMENEVFCEHGREHPAMGGSVQATAKPNRASRS